MMATHPSILLEDVLSCLNGAGITVSEFRSNGLGVSRALQYLRASAENSVLLDFGHSTITGSLMVGGVVNQFFCVPAGSAHITKDLCAGLGTSFEDAELIKIDLNISKIANSNFKSSRAAHYAIPRVTELMTLAFKNFALYRRSLDGGLLFCGGGSSLTGLVEYCAQKFGVKGPLVAQLNGDGAKVFVGVSTGVSSQNHPSPALTLDSSWIALLAQARALVRLRRAISSEKDVRPLSKLRPLWTWLSELSR
jgi:cell division ATPase FtsA